MKNLIILSVVVLATCRLAEGSFFGIFSSPEEPEETTTPAPAPEEEPNSETLTRYFENLATPFSYPPVPVYVTQPIVRSNPINFYTEHQPVIYYASPPNTYEVVQRQQQQIPISYTNVVQQYQQPDPISVSVPAPLVRQQLPYAAFNEYSAPAPQPSVTRVVEQYQQPDPVRLSVHAPVQAPFARQPLPYAAFNEYSVPDSQPSVESVDRLIKAPPPTSSSSTSASTAAPSTEIKFAPAPPTPSPRFTMSSAAQSLDLPMRKNSLDFQTGGYLTGTYTSPTFAAPTENFGHSYDNSDGTRVAERGQVVQFSDGSETVVKTGQYEYIDANGKTVTVKWVADDDGYRVIN